MLSWKTDNLGVCCIFTYYLGFVDSIEYQCCLQMPGVPKSLWVDSMVQDNGQVTRFLFPGPGLIYAPHEDLFPTSIDVFYSTGAHCQ